MQADSTPRRSHILGQAVSGKDVGLVGTPPLPGIFGAGLRLHANGLPRQVECGHQGQEKRCQSHQARGVGIRIAIRGHGSASGGGPSWGLTPRSVAVERRVK